MADDIKQLQQQFQGFLQMYEKDRAQVEELTQKLASLSRNVAEHKGKAREEEVISGNDGRTEGGSPSSHETERGNWAPRHTRLDFPRFDGTEDPIGWINRCDHYFKHQNTSEGDKLELVAIHIEGEAQLWLMKVQQDNPRLSWDEFKELCNAQFGPPMRINPLGELAKLKQGGNVESYRSRFVQLAAQEPSLTSD